MRNVKKISVISMLVSAALVLHITEGILPIPYVAPGVKLGLSNAVTLVAIVVLGLKEALTIVLLRTFLGAMLSGMPSSFLFSAAGGGLSTLVMYIVYSRTGDRFSIIGISIIGAIAHNIGQLFIASIIVDNFGLYLYLPILMIAAVITGFFIGIATRYVIDLTGEKLRLRYGRR